MPVLKSNDSVGKALEWMQEYRIGALIVAENQKYLGIVEEEFLEEFDDSQEIGQLQLIFGDIFLYDYQHIYEALSLISKFQMKTIAVLDEQNNFVGCVTTNDIYERFSALLGTNESGAIIVIQLKNKDYSLAEISRLIESDNAKILSSYFSGAIYDDLNPAMLTLKLNRTEISSIIATLERFGYNVESSFAHLPVESLEQERFDMLMKYLSI